MTITLTKIVTNKEVENSNKFDNKNYTEINYFNELQLILRFIRNKEPYTISK